MDWRKTALLFAAVAALCLVAAALALRAAVDPQRLKKIAADRAIAAWDRELRVGDIDLDLLPVPSLRATQVSLGNAPWAKAPQLIQADIVRAELEVLPLLSGKVRVRKLSLDGVTANLEVAEDGARNWSLAKAKAESGETPPAEADMLKLDSIYLHDARIVVRRRGVEGAPWIVERAHLATAPALRDVRVDARLLRNGRGLVVKARFDDLSRHGVAGEVSGGVVELDWEAARLAISGRFPLQREARGLDLGVSLKADSLHELFAFYGIAREKSAPMQLSLRAREKGGAVEVSEISASMGQLRVAGDAKVTMKPEPRIHARLRSDRIDWLRTIVEAGGKPKPKRHDGEVFHPDPVAWRVVTAVGTFDGTAELSVASLKLGNGIEVANARGKLVFGDGRMDLAPFSGQALGGSVKGAMKFDGRKRTLRFELDGENVLLQRWFHERGSKIPFEGGPMSVKARLSLAGASYRELAASVSGPLTIRMGKGVWKSPRAGEAEEKMVRVFAPQDGTDVAFECAAADLEFKSGRAEGRGIFAARTDISQLLASGSVDAREETVDLRGRMVPRKGPRIGLSSIAGEVQITGKFARLGMQLDPSAAPAVLARAGAAVATAGVTVIGTALADAAEAKNDPCKRRG